MEEASSNGFLDGLRVRVNDWFEKRVLSGKQIVLGLSVFVAFLGFVQAWRFLELNQGVLMPLASLVFVALVVEVGKFYSSKVNAIGF